jgi:hypothetical protein
MIVEEQYIAFIESLRRDNESRFHSSAMRWNELANNRSSQLSAQLFTCASLVIPLSFLPLGNNNLTGYMTWFDKKLLILAWSILVASLIIGLFHLRKEVRFFNDWSEQESKRSLEYSVGIFSSRAKQAFERLEEMNKKSTKLAKMSTKPSLLFLYLQLSSLLIGVMLVMFVLGSLMFA